MISGMGLALGIDYALFVVSRYREERRRGRDKLDAIETSGRDVEPRRALQRARVRGRDARHAARAGADLPQPRARRDPRRRHVRRRGADPPPGRAQPARRPRRTRSVSRSSGAAAEAGTDGEGRFWHWAIGRVMRRPVPALVVVVGLLLAAALPLLTFQTGTSGVEQPPGPLRVEARLPRARARLRRRADRPGADRRRRRRRRARGAGRARPPDRALDGSAPSARRRDDEPRRRPRPPLRARRAATRSASARPTRCASCAPTSSRPPSRASTPRSSSPARRPSRSTSRR